KPSLDQINPFLGLLVDDLLEFWEPGVWFSRTAKSTSRHLVRAALVPLICDVVGARQVVGLGAHSSKYFCSFCLLKSQDIENFDISTWPRRTAHDHLRNAERWRDASSAEERGKIFEDHGVRWSELLRLPYWDSIKYTVVDSMHNLYLGLIKTHCRNVWGIDFNIEGGDASAHPNKPPPLQPSSDDMKAGTHALYYKSLSALSKCSKAEAFASIHEVHESMQLPSWINPVPRGFGTTKHGKLSADQWHTACMTLLPVALVLLWGNETERKLRMLENFMDLATAVVLAGMWSISEAHIELFEMYLRKYLEGLKELYKEAKIVPNHHLALHLPDFMRLFGPVHSWRSFVFERFNYILQHMNTNLTFG
ncbi:hypothetical protein C8Q70DRAFT_883959, partial [Cubamyces menziesii]